MISKTALKNIDDYIASQDVAVRPSLEKLRQTIRKAAPKAIESISYGMPTFKFHGPLAYFAAYKKHIGFYPMPAAIKHFSLELQKFETSKGTVRFPIDKPLPFTLISKMVKFNATVRLRSL